MILLILCHNKLQKIYLIRFCVYLTHKHTYTNCHRSVQGSHKVRPDLHAGCVEEQRPRPDGGAAEIENL